MLNDQDFSHQINWKFLPQIFLIPIPQFIISTFVHKLEELFVAGGKEFENNFLIIFDPDGIRNNNRLHAYLFIPIHILITQYL